MNKKQKVVLICPIIVMGIILGYSRVMGIALGFNAPSLEFPIAESDRIERLSAYHTPDWGEPGVFHNGIDLVISNNVTIVSPISGTIMAYSERINPYAGNVLFDIAIAINWGWEVHLTMEPGFTDDVNNSLQSSLIDVNPPQHVELGDELATLLFSGNYPHLHYMLLYLGSDVCAYNYSSSAAAGIFDDLAVDTNSTILYPCTPANPLLTPLGIILIGTGSIYLLVVLIVFRPRK
jgi:murein DD-endopeptidase MepM/ murein hydrolase activator NlpD